MSLSKEADEAGLGRGPGLDQAAGRLRLCERGDGLQACGDGSAGRMLCSLRRTPRRPSLASAASHAPPGWAFDAAARIAPAVAVITRRCRGRSGGERGAIVSRGARAARPGRPYCADTASGAQTGPEPITYDNRTGLAATQEIAANRLC